jgi:hypothetical protein
MCIHCGCFKDMQLSFSFTFKKSKLDIDSLKRGWSYYKDRMGNQSSIRLNFMTDSLYNKPNSNPLAIKITRVEYMMFRTYDASICTRRRTNIY